MIMNLKKKKPIGILILGLNHQNNICFINTQFKIIFSLTKLYFQKVSYNYIYKKEHEKNYITSDMKEEHKEKIVLPGEEARVC